MTKTFSQEKLAPVLAYSPDMPDVPKVSVVIIFLNAEKYLGEAIESVFSQTFTDWELLLVDDGSMDRSTEVALSYARQFATKVTYLQHENHINKGMSASRNLGIERSKGKYIALLDADDVWLPGKLKSQVQILEQHPEVALVATPAMYWYEDGSRRPQPMTIAPGIVSAGSWIPKILENDNNAACPSAVLMNRELIQRLGGFEDSFRGPLMLFEDQVTWFKLNLEFPVYYTPEQLLLYRIHSESCCMSTPIDQQRAARVVLYSRLIKMLMNPLAADVRRTSLKIMAYSRLCQLLLQASGRSENGAQNGTIINRSPKLTSDQQFYGVLGKFFTFLLLLGRVSETLASGLLSRAFVIGRVADEEGFFGVIKRVPRYLNKKLANFLPKSIRALASKSLQLVSVAKARIRLGIGVRPLSLLWGSDRGLAIHRYYLGQFLQEFRADVRGHCLDFQQDTYATRIGGRAVSKVDVLHIDDSNPLATIIADLTKPNSIPGNQFDCVICTHVLHIIGELDRAVAELYRILKPGGVLLVAVPQVSMCDPGYHEMWRFTAEGLSFLLAKAFGAENVIVRAYGNSLTTAGEIRGLVSTEFSPSVLDYHDPRFAVEVCARAIKQSESISA
jgi:glycosyltransferase involved in cell wall biosynthesis/SAM-dependent methyltransferase